MGVFILGDIIVRKNPSKRTEPPTDHLLIVEKRNFIYKALFIDGEYEGGHFYFPYDNCDNFFLTRNVFVR